MPANRFNNHTDYGIGIGLRVPHYSHILEKKPVVDWFEIISENFMVDGGRPLEVLDEILEQYRVVQHGVSMYFGSADKPDPAHLKRLKTLVKRTKTPWLSDHLCWGSVDGTYTHDLLPMPYTFAAAKRTAEKIRQVRDYLEVPICVENVSSYAEYHVSEMTEWEFLTEVVERADCGILLDVNNIYVSSKNHGFNPYDYVNGVPHGRVGQMHVAGHTKFEKYILDTHDHPVLDPVWKLYAHATKLCGVTATLLEWDDKIPSFDEVHDEALKANEFIDGAKEGQAKERKGKDGQGKDGQAKEGEAKKGQAKEGQGKEGQGKVGQAKEGQAKEGQGKVGTGVPPVRANRRAIRRARTGGDTRPYLENAISNTADCPIQT